MNKFTRFLVLLTLAVVVAWSAPLTFLQDANAYDGEQPGQITLEFHGTVVSPGSCQQIAANSINCTVFVGQQSAVNLTATRTPPGAVTIAAVALPPGSSFSPVTGANGTATATWSFQPTTNGTYNATFQASTLDPLSVQLSIIFNVVLPELPKIKVSPASLDFGEVPVGNKTEQELTIENIGEAELWINAVAIKGGANSTFDLCGRAWTAYTLAPGESTNLTVCFSPKTTGLFKDEVLINSNDPTKPTVAVPAQGSAVLPKLPKIEVSPARLDFGGVSAGNKTEQELTIKNIGEEVLVITDVTIKGGDSSPFDLCGEIWGGYTYRRVAPNQSTNLAVCFSPKTAGLFKDEVLISHNDVTRGMVSVLVQGNATRKNSTISCEFMAAPKPGGMTYLPETVREVEVIVTVEISPPHSAEYALNITDANGRSRGPFAYKADANGEDKQYLVVNGTIRNGRVAGTWRCEVSWKGDEDHEGASSQCAFNVSELGLYGGTEAGPTATKPARASNEIDITYAGFCTENCSKIVFIQVVTYTAVFVGGGSTSKIKPSDVTPEWAFKDNATVEVGDRLFLVDHVKGERDPYYNGDDRVAGCTTLTFDFGDQGNHTTVRRPATMDDGPRRSDNAFDRIGNAQTPSKNVTKMTLEFETFAFCVDGRDKGEFYQGIKWRWEREKGAAGFGKSVIIEVVSEPSEGFMKALEKWCANHPAFVLPKP